MVTVASTTASRRLPTHPLYTYTAAPSLIRLAGSFRRLRRALRVSAAVEEADVLLGLGAGDLEMVPVGLLEELPKGTLGAASSTSAGSPSRATWVGDLPQLAPAGPLAVATAATRCSIGVSTWSSCSAPAPTCLPSSSTSTRTTGMGGPSLSGRPTRRPSGQTLFSPR